MLGRATRFSVKKKIFKGTPGGPRGAKFASNFGHFWGRPPPQKLCAKMCKNDVFLHKKWWFLTIFDPAVHENDAFSASILPRIVSACPCGKNPPIYTVLNARFRAPPTRRWHRGGNTPPDGSPADPPGAPTVTPPPKPMNKTVVLFSMHERWCHNYFF